MTAARHPGTSRPAAFAPGAPPRRSLRARARRALRAVAVAAAHAALLVATAARAADSGHPLEPPDRSSPSAALSTFLGSSDALAAFLVDDYLPSQSRAEFERAVELARIPVESLDLHEVPPAMRDKSGRSAAVALYEVLARVPLPAPATIPGGAAAGVPPAAPPARWTLPHTEITLVRVADGPRSGEYLFSAETVARAAEFYDRVRDRPYLRPMPLPHMHDIVATGSGWMIPNEWVRALPAWLRSPLGEQATWKWIALAVVVAAAAFAVRLVARATRPREGRSELGESVARLAAPAAVLVLTPVVAWFALLQFNFVGGAAGVIEVAATTAGFLSAAWLAVRLGPVAAEAALTSPRVARQPVDAHLLRVTARLLGIVAGMALLGVGADQLGVPVVGIVAGLGVGGLTLALAAQPTIENLIGGLNLFADKPLRVGDLCRYGDDVGTVEEIGLRSSRLRGADRTVTTVPNAALAKMSITNLSRRDRIPLQTVVGLRYETTPSQLRDVLAGLRDLLASHPRLHPGSGRAVLSAFGASSLDVEVFVLTNTSDPIEFTTVREDVLLRVLDVVERCGTGLAFPSQTVYLGRDVPPGAPPGRP